MSKDGAKTAYIPRASHTCPLLVSHLAQSTNPGIIIQGHLHVSIP